MLVQATVAYLNSPQGKQAVRQTTEQLEGVIQSAVSFAKQGMGESEDEGQKTPAPKAGSAEGEGSGKRFQESVKEGEKEASDNTCRLCGTKTTEESGPKRSEIDHAIPRSRGGDNSPENAQNTCRTCNRQKGSKTTDEYLKSKGTQKSQPKLSNCEPATKTCTGATFLGAGYHN